jgi:hypothetical protein
MKHEKETMTLNLPSNEMAALGRLSSKTKFNRTYLVREALRMLFREHGISLDEPLPVPVKRVKKVPTIQRHVSYYMNMKLEDLMSTYKDH